MNKTFTLSVLAATALVAVGTAEARLTLSEARARGAVASTEVRHIEPRALPTAGSVTIIGDTDPQQAQAPMKRLSGKGSAIYGYLSFADQYRFIPGMTELDGHAFGRIWNDPRYISDDAIMTAGWLVGDRVCGIATYSLMGMTLATYTVECDLASGRTIEFAELPAGTPVFSTATLAKDDNRVYGIVKRDNKFFFAYAPVENPTQLTDICEAGDDMHLISITYRDDDNTLYGVNTSGEFLRIGRDGKTTEIALLDTGREVAGYCTGLVYVPADREFVWNVNFSDYSAANYTIDPETYALTLIDECPYNEQYSFFVCPDDAYDAAAPCRPQLGTIDFPNGGLKGSVTFVLPDKTQEGEALSGELSYTISFDNEPYSEGKAAPGSTVKAEFDHVTEGFHTFGIIAESNGHKTPMQLASAFIGEDVPLAPTGVTLSQDRLSWNPVTGGVNGGYVDAANMQYHIFFEGEEVGQTSGTSFVPDLPTDRPISAFTMSVAAEYDNLWSSQSGSNYIVLGEPLRMPVEIKPTYDQIMTCTGVDANDSDNAWSYDSGDASFKMLMNDKDADAWIFMPPIEFESADCFYTLSFQGRSLDSKCTDEELGVYIGSAPTPDAMTEVGETFAPAGSYTIYERLLKADAPGAYYIGFRYTSKAGQYGVAVRNVSVIDGGVQPDSPARPSDITAMAASQGELKARVDFTFPTLDVSGQPIPADTRLRAIIAGENKTVVTGKPGDKGYGTVNTLQGDNRLSVTVSIGEKNSPVGYVDVYTGVVKPEAITSVGFMPLDDLMGVTVAWSNVSKGENGGYVDPSKITYTVLRYEDNGYTQTWIPLAEKLTDSMYTYELEPGTPQQLLRLGICAENAAGRGNITMVGLVAGTPYTLPMEDNFAIAGDEGAKYAPYVNSRPSAAYTSSFLFVTPEELGSEFADEEGFYFAASGAPGAKARLGLPCFSTKDCGAEVSITALCGNGFAPLSIYADCASYNNPVLVGTMPEEGGLVTKSFRLPEATDRRGWVQLFVDGTITSDGMLALRGYSVTPVDKVASASASGLSVKSGKGMAEVTGAEGRIEIFNTAGVRVALKDNAAHKEAFLLPAGVYLLRANGQTVKTIVK